MKNKVIGNFEKTFKNFLQKIAKNALFCIFFNIFSKPCVTFSRVWTKNANCWEILKISDENSIEKLNFYFILNFIFRKFVTKNRAFGNNHFSTTIFSLSGGFPPFPLATPLATDPERTLASESWQKANKFRSLAGCRHNVRLWNLL